MRLIMNSSSILAAGYQLIIFSALILIIRVLFTYVFACLGFWQKFENHVRWNALLRLYLVAFLAMFLSAVLNMQTLNLSRFAEKLSTSITWIMIIGTGLFIPIMCYRLKRFRSAFDSHYMLERFSTIYSEFKDDHFYEYMHTAVFLIRRILYCMILIYAYYDALTQLILF